MNPGSVAGAEQCLLFRGADPAELLNQCVAAVEDDTGELIRKIYRELAGETLDTAGLAHGFAPGFV